MDSGQFLLTFIIMVLPMLISKLFSTTHSRHKKLPPSPKKLPILGNLHELMGDLPHIALHKLSKKHGPFMLLQLGSFPTLVISSADVVRKIFKTHDLIFSNRPHLYAANRLSYGSSNITFAPYGAYWREIRKIIVHELLSPKRVDSFRQVRIDEVKIMIDFIDQSFSRPVDLTKLMFSLVNNVVCRVAFGKKYGDSKSKFIEMLNGIQGLAGELNIADYYPWLGWLVSKVNGVDMRLERTFKDMDELFDEVIEEHLDESRVINVDHEDIVDVLLRTQRDPNRSISITNNQLKGLLMDTYVAGTDTSTATLVWIMTELIKNPLTMKTAQDEVRRVIKRKQRVDECDLPNLAYLKLVIKETLRMHPPAPLLVPRETTEPCIVANYEIPAKTRVIINAKAIGMDSKVWDNPNKFDPDRFLNVSIDYKGFDYELIPFGVGRRGCPGLNFAVVLVELTLANLLYCFDWSLPEGMTGDDIDMAEAIGVTTHKKEPLVLVATRKT